jgi:hypothetical protein
MNMNASLYANGVGGMSEHFGVSEQAVRVGQVSSGELGRVRER